MKKKTSLLCLLLSLCLLASSLTGCGASAPAAKEAPAPAAAAEDTAAGENGFQNESTSDASDDTQTAYPVTLTDQLGRQVTIGKKPESIVSAYYISTSLLLALNQKDRLVGIEAKADTRPLYELAAPSFPDLPNVGTAKEFNLEACASLSPDLIVLPAKLKDVLPSLEELGLPVLAVNPEDQELLKEAVTLLGAAVNENDTAKRLLGFSSDALGEMTTAVQGTEKPLVYLAGNSSLLSTAGPAMYQNSLIANAGGTNAAESVGDSYWAEISYEQLLAWNPEVIVLAADASYSVDSVLKDPNLAECRAVQNGQVYQFPNAIEAWDSPVPGGMLGSLWLASVLHPDEYPAENWQANATKFYKDFYRFTPTLQ